MITSNEKLEWNKCYLCNSMHLKPLYLDKNIYKCKDCNFVFYKNIPSSDDLNMIYSNYSREEYITEISRKKISRELNSLLRTHKIENVLDIASGECYFLDILHDINPELNLFATEHETAKNRVISKGHTFIEGEFFPKTDIKFDLIIFTEAIEHINDVEKFLNNAYELLNQGGLIYITTPNFNSLERLIMGKKWGMVIPPEHLSYFTTSTLHKIMTKSKFLKVFSKTENISIYRVIEFINNYLHFFKNKKSSNNSPQEISDRLQKASSDSALLKLFKNIVNFVLKSFNLGSSLKALYQKN
jgi:2-polyprenyl-3-methyl-5-hydroxy-6-metoxy-1,4-benzoquinol methylase